MMKLARPAAKGLLLMTLGLPVAAEPFPPLPPIVITPGRVAQVADATPAATTVIERADIERLQARSVPGLLDGLPGVSLARTGGPGQQTSVFLRGTDSDQVLVLVDGVKVGSATTGTTPLEHLPVALIERIEVVRGPHSSLYGSEAIGGVIQIFTRKGGGRFRPSLSLGAGSYATYEGAVSLAAGGAHGWFNTTLSGANSNGFNACTGDPITFAGCATDEPDRDGYRNRSGAVRTGYRFANGIEIGANWVRVTGNTDFDGDFQNQSESLQQVLGARLQARPLDRWSVELQGGRSRDDLDTYKDGDFRTRFDTERDLLSLQNDITVAVGQVLSLGADYQHDRVSGTTDYSVDTRENIGVFAQYLGYLQGNEIQASLRRDDNQQFGTHTTGNLAWGYRFEAGPRLTAAYGTAFKAPNFNELYFPADPVFGGGGNPDLEPEKSRSIEVGLSGTAALWDWSLYAFQTRIDDLIVSGPETAFVPFNVAQARIRGLEAETNVRLAGWQLFGSLTLLDPRDEDTGKLLPRRPEQTLRIDLDRRFDHYSLGATLVAVGRRFDDIANTRRLAPYAILDLRGEYRIDDAWRIQARVDNLLDKDYETVAFYNQPGRSLFVTLRYEP